MTSVHGFLASLAVSVAVPASLSGQAVQGVVARADSDERLVGVTVALVPVAPDGPDLGEITTGSDGSFLIDVPEPGQYVLSVRALGYHPQFAILDLSRDQVVALRINLAAMAVVLDGVTVYGLEAATDGQREFWSRRDLPWNFSYVYTEFEDLGANQLSEVLYFGVLGGRKVASCALIYRDGLLLDRRYWELDDISLDWVYGVEVYRDYYAVPIRYRDPFRGGAGCGAILIWTHEVGKGR